jgi:hypothetical protein
MTEDANVRYAGEEQDKARYFQKEKARTRRQGFVADGPARF